jgi:hypothetical protein
VASAAGSVDQPAPHPTYTPARLSFDGWSETPDEPVVLGGRGYPGDASDPRAVADAIAGLLFEPA